MAYRLVRECLNGPEWEAWEEAAKPFLHPYYSEYQNMKRLDWLLRLERAKEQIRALLLPNG